MNVPRFLKCVFSILQKSNNRKTLSGALLLGVLHVFSFAPFGLWYLQFISLGGLYLLWQHASRAVNTKKNVCSSAQLGLAFGLGWFGFGVYWTFIAMYAHTELPTIVAILGTSIFSSLLACFPMLAGFLWHRLHQKINVQHSVLLYASVWLITEWLRGSLLTGFPWLNHGYAHTHGLLAGFAPIISYLGVSWLVTLSAALFAVCCANSISKTRSIAKIFLASFTLFVILSVGAFLNATHWTHPVGKPLRIALLQANIEQNVKFLPSQQHGSLDVYEQLAKQSALAKNTQEKLAQEKLDLIIMPETGVPDFWQNLAFSNPSYLERLQNLTQYSHYGVITGIPIAEKKASEKSDIEDPNTQIQYTNSAILFNQHDDMLNNQYTQRYNKRHLVPFGEFMPLGFQWFVNAMNMPLGSFTKGETKQANFSVRDQSLGMLICYEDLFIEQAYTTLPQASILVNLSNLGWYDDSIALAQHLQISQMRALETGRPLIRATNTGVTAIITSKGIVADALPIVKQGQLVDNIQGYQGQTPIVWLYTQLGFWGIDLFYLLLSLLGLLSFNFKRTAKQISSSTQDSSKG